MATFPAIVPDHPATKEIKIRETRQPLGDGTEYVVRFGLNPVDTTWRLVWTRLDVDELFEIEQFLEARAADGEPFEWTPPDAETEQRFRVDQWEPARSKPTGWSLDLVFRREIELVALPGCPGDGYEFPYDEETPLPEWGITFSAGGTDATEEDPAQPGQTLVVELSLLNETQYQGELFWSLLPSEDFEEPTYGAYEEEMLPGPQGGSWCINVSGAQSEIETLSRPILAPLPTGGTELIAVDVVISGGEYAYRFTAFISRFAPA
jgi:phage-related protein